MTALSVLALLVLTQAPAPAAEPADAESEGDSIVLAPKVGFFKSTTPLGGAPYLALEVGYVTPLLQRHLAIVVEGSFHQPKTSGTLGDPQLTLGEKEYRLTQRELALMLSAVYRFEGAWGSITPYAGAGPGLYLHQTTTQGFGATTLEKEGTLGFQLLGGAEWHLGPGGLFLEAHYHFAPVGFRATGSVNLGGVLAGLGYRLRL
jgi:opacity protein-like surface antigen